MTEKYGFVYIWYNRSHNRFYIGSHWGSEDDGYLCSSNWMRKSYYRNPQDFKRRILSRIYTDRKETLLKEGEWLSLIKDEELGKRYYNLRNKVYDEVWYANEEKRKTVSERISASVKRNYEDPEFKAKMDEALAKRDLSKASDPDVIERKRKKMKAYLEKKFPLENRKKRLAKDSPELNKIYSESASNYWQTIDPEKGKIHREKIRQGMLGKKNRLGQKNSEEHCANISKGKKGKPLSEFGKLAIQIAAKNMDPLLRKVKAKKHSETMSNRLWINNTVKSMMIQKEDLDKYLNDGWVLGRPKKSV